MTIGNQTPNYSLSQEELHRLFEQQVRDAMIRKEKAEADELWPLHVAQALTLLTGKISALEARLAAGEAFRG